MISWQKAKAAQKDAERQPRGAQQSRSQGTGSHGTGSQGTGSQGTGSQAPEASYAESIYRKVRDEADEILFEKLMKKWCK
jgi:hypothetical protein